MGKGASTRPHPLQEEAAHVCTRSWQIRRFFVFSPYLSHFSSDLTFVWSYGLLFQWYIWLCKEIRLTSSIFWILQQFFGGYPFPIRPLPLLRFLPRFSPTFSSYFCRNSLSHSRSYFSLKVLSKWHGFGSQNFEMAWELGFKLIYRILNQFFFAKCPI